jgi:hypothetical protein
LPKGEVAVWAYFHMMLINRDRCGTRVSPHVRYCSILREIFYVEYRQRAPDIIVVLAGLDLQQPYIFGRRPRGCCRDSFENVIQASSKACILILNIQAWTARCKTESSDLYRWQRLAATKVPQEMIPAQWKFQIICSNISKFVCLHNTALHERCIAIHEL